MDNLQTPQTQEQKDFLEKEMGLKPFEPLREPNYANPDRSECKSTNLSSLNCACLFHLQIICSVPRFSVFPSLVATKLVNGVCPRFHSPSRSSWCQPSTFWRSTIKRRDSISPRVRERHSSRTLNFIQLHVVHGIEPLPSMKDSQTSSDLEIIILQSYTI